MALIEQGKAQGQIAGDDVRRAFEADQIPATQWKNVLRSLNQVLDEEGVTLMVSAAEAPKRSRKSVAAKSPAKRTATKPVTSTTAVRKKTAAAKTVATAAGTAEVVIEADTVEDPESSTEPAVEKKTAAKKAAPKKSVAKKTAAKKTVSKKGDDELIEAEELVGEA